MVAASTRAKLREAARIQWSDPTRRERILAGQRAARLVRDNLALATWAASRYLWSRLDFDDLRQAAVLGLHQAATKYDPGRGAKFSTVAAWYMFSAIRAEIANMRSTVRAPGYRPAPRVGSLDERPLRAVLPSDEQDGPEVAAEHALLRERVGEALGTLPDRERFVVEARWGLNGHDGRTHTLDEIAPMLGVSRARVGQIEARALERLRFRLPRT